MGFWAWMKRAFSPTLTLDSSTPRPIDTMFAQMLGSGLSPRVSRAEALTVPAVLKGRNLLTTPSTLPLVQLGPGNVRVRNPLLEQIDPNLSNVVTLAYTLEDLAFESVAWWRILALGFDQFPVSARRIDPSTVTVDPPQGSTLPAGLAKGDVVWIDGKMVSATEVIRFDSPNPAILKACGRAIRRAILFDKTASRYADDPRPLDYFTPADGADSITDDEAEEIISSWRAQRRKGNTAYVPAALKYNTADVPTPVELQLADLEKQAGLQLANAFGIDPEELGISTTSRTYSNNVDRKRDRINDVHAPLMLAIAQRLSMGDVTKRGYRIVFDLDDYLKANPTERWQVYSLAKSMGVLTAEEIRATEGLPVPVGAADPAPGGVTASSPPTLHAVNFEDLQTFTLDVPVQDFTVNAGERTVEGLVVPYGQVGQKGGLRFRFDRGSLQYGDVNRIKLLRDHDTSKLLGVATEIKDGPAGVRVKFRLGRGPDADQALSDAEDGLLDGFSVGVDFDVVADTTPDPRNRGALLVKRADWRETSLTPMPAFDNARVARVAASRTGGQQMDECATCGQRHAPGEACPTTTIPIPEPAAQGVTLGDGVTLSASRLAQMLGTDDGRAMLGQLVAQHPGGHIAGQRMVTAALDPGRQFVNAAGPGMGTTVTTRVTEPSPYRFDRRGNLAPGSHDFSQDLFAAKAGDTAAMARATEFVRVAFDVATGDVNELNPTRQRPDMYVDQRDFQYPLWDAINKGTLADITPFTFPKFSSASGLVGAHTEGVEPTSGTLVTTSQTVTPTAISGKAKITRETWDQGGNPQVSSLIWNQMKKGWFEALEAAAVAVLDAASPTQIDLSGSPGLSDEQLDDALTQAFASLQYVRGGFSMDNLFTQIDLYKALVGAKDSTGRHLFPALGPTNASGTVRARWAALDLNGVLALPAWALAASGAVAASSYLFDSADVHGWASAPQRLDFTMIEVAFVEIAIWGYKATAISDITGVREIVYDPA